ncbi:hypothetical protein KIL84_008802 [Mauremys mutica]|uniref:Uncharacterized protein n=1 Tax=Mauremys mutica TaxID=74926 RepID=A0A9D4AZP8_9SAUR|nr:hypothetical protein KIL84_008802 [Mauremys mutica]
MLTPGTHALWASPLIPGPVTPGSPAPEAGHAGGRGAHADLALWQPSLRLVALWVGGLARPGSTAQAKPGGGPWLPLSDPTPWALLTLTTPAEISSVLPPARAWPPSSSSHSCIPAQPSLPSGLKALVCSGSAAPTPLQYCSPLSSGLLQLTPSQGGSTLGPCPMPQPRQCRGPAERDLPWM